jgi:hypothetical protein
MIKKAKRKPVAKVPEMVSPVYYAASSFAVNAVEAPLATVREKLQAWRPHEWYCDVHLGPVQPVMARPFLSDYALCVGLTGATWVLASIPWQQDVAAQLSREFATRTVNLEYEDTGDTLTYRLYHHGELREEYFHCLQEQSSGFKSTWRPGLQPGDDEHRFVDETFRELSLRLPYAWLEPLTNGRFYGRAGFGLDFSGEPVRAERPVPTIPLPRVPGELGPEEIAGFDVAVF